MLGKKGIPYHKHAYNHPSAVSDYEQDRFSGALGPMRRRRESVAAFAAIQQFMPGSTVLDCPSGIGRWFERLGLRARRIIAIDAAELMVEAARARRIPGVDIEVRVGDAEALELEDGAVDHVFCYALMKHVPPATRARMLREFARVASSRIAVSFVFFNPLSRVRWALNGSRGFPLWPDELDQVASEANLRVGAIYPVGAPLIGMEAIVVFERERRSL